MTERDPEQPETLSERYEKLHDAKSGKWWWPRSPAERDLRQAKVKIAEMELRIAELEKLIPRVERIAEHLNKRKGGG